MHGLKIKDLKNQNGYDILYNEIMKIQNISYGVTNNFEGVHEYKATLIAEFNSAEEFGCFAGNLNSYKDYELVARNPEGGYTEKINDSYTEIEKLKKKISDKERKIKELEEEIEKLQERWEKKKEEDFSDPLNALDIG